MNKALGTYISPHTTESHKYTGPLSIVTYDGPRNIEKQMHGHGKVLFANDSTYEGDFAHDMLNGYGILTDTSTGNVYAGEFKDDMRHGQGTFTYVGGKYEGQYLNNKRHGVGKETDSEGNTFEGRFENGDFVHGRVFYENDDIYVGEYKGDAKNGKGKLIRFEDGAEFEGEWVDDVFQG